MALDPEGLPLRSESHMKLCCLVKPVAMFLLITPLLPFAVAQQSTPEGETAQQKGDQVLRRIVVAPDYRKWLLEDVRYIITDEERADFKKLTTDRQRDQFITDFWDKRNPNPGSAENAFKERHYQRLAYANQHYAAAIPGWKSDRGRLYIMYGPPDSVDSKPRLSPPEEVWHYNMIDGIGADVVFNFVDRCSCGEYALSKGNVDSVPRTLDHMNPQ
jgi:GWxTD domain-containing protein